MINIIEEKIYAFGHDFLHQNLLHKIEDEKEACHSRQKMTVRGIVRVWVYGL